MHSHKEKLGKVVLVTLALLFLLFIASRPWEEEGAEGTGPPLSGTLAGAEEAESKPLGAAPAESEKIAEVEPTTEAEEAGVEQATETSPLLGEEIESHTLQVNGTVLSLPCTVGELEATGFLLCREDKEEIEGYLGEAGDYEAKFEDGRGNFMTTAVFIPSAEANVTEEFQVIEIEVEKWGLKNGGATVVFPGSIQIGGSMGEDVLAQYSPPDMIVYGENGWKYEREDADTAYLWFDDYYDYNDARIVTDKEGWVDRMLLSYGGKQERMKKEFVEMVLGRWSPYPESGEKSLHTVEFRRYPEMGSGKTPYVEYVDEGGTYYGYNTYEVVDDKTIRAVFNCFHSADGEITWREEPQKGFSATFTYDEERMELKAEYYGNVPDIKKEEKTLYKIKTTDIWGQAWRRKSNEVS